MTSEASYEPPDVLDLGTLVEITGGTGMGQRDDPASDANAKT
jgi:hypothetical protein